MWDNRSQPTVLPLDQELDRVFVKDKKFYLTKGSNGSNNGCSFVRVLEDGSTLTNIHDVCHASMMNGGLDRPIKEVYTSLYVQKKKNLEACNRFIEWLFSSESPWGKAAKGAELFYDEHDVPLYAKIVTADDPEVPAPLFMHLIIMSRIVYEKSDCIKVWDVLVNKYGYTPERALAYAYHLRFTDEKNKLVRFNGDGHLFLNHNVLDIKRMENQDPLLDAWQSLPFNKNNVGPCAKMWDTVELFNYRDIHHEENKPGSPPVEKKKKKELVFKLLQPQVYEEKLDFDVCLDRVLTNVMEKQYAT